MNETETPAPQPRWRLPRPNRERLVELAVIVFGILIALGLENMVQEWRWKQEARELEALARTEMEGSLFQAIERIAVDPCLRERVVFLAQGLNGDAAAYSPQADTRTNSNGALLGLPTAYRPLLRPWRTAHLERLLGSEAAKRVPAVQLIDHARVLTTLDGLKREASDEVIASGRLLPLALGIPRLEPEIQATLLADLGDLDRARSGAEVFSRRVIDRGVDLKVSPDPQEVEERLDALREDWGDCVDVAEGIALSQRLTSASRT